MKTIESLSYELYLEIKDTSRIIIMYFGATWCDGCKLLKANLCKLNEERIPNVYIYQVDVSNNQELTDIFNVTSIPTTVVIYKKKIIAKEIGYRSCDNFKKIIQDITSKS